MLDLDFPPLESFPVFNVADIGITVGAVLVALLMMREESGGTEPAVIVRPAPAGITWFCRHFQLSPGK